MYEGIEEVAFLVPKDERRKTITLIETKNPPLETYTLYNVLY